MEQWAPWIIAAIATVLITYVGFLVIILRFIWRTHRRIERGHREMDVRQREFDQRFEDRRASIRSGARRAA